MIATDYIFGRKQKNLSSDMNTYIGNLADVYPTKESLASVLNIDVEFITAYVLNGNDIEASIQADYNILGGFNGRAITYYRDYGGFCKLLGSGAFQSTNMTDVYLAGCLETLGDSSNGPFRDTTIGTVDFPELIIMGPSCFKFCSAQSIDAPKVTTLSLSSLDRCRDLQYLNLPSIENYTADFCLMVEAVAGGVVNIPWATFNNGNPHYNIEILGKRLVINFVGYTPTGNYNTLIGNMASVINSREKFAQIMQISTAYVLEYNAAGTDVELLIETTYNVRGLTSQTQMTYYYDNGGKVNQISGSGLRGVGNISIHFPAVTRIETQAFRGTTCIDEVLNFPELTYINDGWKFGSLKSINAPKLKTVVNYPFYEAFRANSQIYFPALTTIGPDTLNNECFRNIPASASLTLPIALQTANAGAEEGDIAYCRSRGCTINYI